MKRHMCMAIPGPYTVPLLMAGTLWARYADEHNLAGAFESFRSPCFFQGPLNLSGEFEWALEFWNGP